MSGGREEPDAEQGRGVKARKGREREQGRGRKAVKGSEGREGNGPKEAIESRKDVGTDTDGEGKTCKDS